MSFTQRARSRTAEVDRRNPWSTEPELPPDEGRTFAAPDFDARRALKELDHSTQFLIEELVAEIDGLRPLLVVEPSAEALYVAAVRRLAAAEQTALDLHDALTRLNEGTYGFCVTCTKRIPAARLELLPHTRSCVPCS